MRLSRVLGRTLRQAPADAQLASHQLLIRAGYVRVLEGGVFAYLPLGERALRRLQAFIEKELALMGGQEIRIPAMAGNDPLFEVIRREVDSYRQLPVLVFQAGAGPASPPHPRLGLFGASERPVLSAHAFGAESAPGRLADLVQQIERTVEHALAACELDGIWAVGGQARRLLYFVHPAGDEFLVRCPACNYAAERSFASTTWPAPPNEPEMEPEEIATPGCNTIAALAEFLNVPTAKTLKMVFYSVAGHVSCVVIRGDRAVDEDKLARLLGTERYYTSVEDELEAIGAVGGYASPIGLRADRVRIVADPSVRSGRNWITGANRPDVHLRNVNIPRDFDPGEWADLALIEPSDPCPQCGNPVAVERAFRLGDAELPAPINAEYLDEAGRPQAVQRASWRLDLGRLLPAVVERHYDGYGIVWPAACAPFDVHLVGLDLRQEPVAAQAEGLYSELTARGLSVLFDDRDASAGVKFADADLIGVPLRLTVSKRSAQEGLIEAKWRNAADRLKLDQEGLAAELGRLAG